MGITIHITPLVQSHPGLWDYFHGANVSSSITSLSVKIIFDEGELTLRIFKQGNHLYMGSLLMFQVNWCSRGLGEVGSWGAWWLGLWLKSDILSMMIT